MTAASIRSTDFRRLVVDLGATALLIGVLFGSLLLFGKAETAGKFILIPLAAFVSFSLWERLVSPAGPRKSLRQWFLHLQINLFTLFMFLPAGILGTAMAAFICRRLGFSPGLIDLRFAGGLGVVALIGAVLVSAIVSDFFFYWFHRSLHASPFLWQHHKLHHMDEELDAVTVSRQNWMEAIFQTVFMIIPMSILFKFDNVDVFRLGVQNGLIVGGFSVLLGYIIHANFRLHLGKATALWCGPQLHRIHHSRLPQHQDKNFCRSFPLWDVLFGTYYAPARDEYPPTGVDGEREIQSFWESQIFTQREWWKMFRAWRSRRV